MDGVLDVKSSQPILIIALRPANNQRNDAIVVTIPVTDIDNPPSVDIVRFPHFADGGGISLKWSCAEAKTLRVKRAVSIDESGTPGRSAVE
jgi:hypothetical protein